MRLAVAGLGLSRQSGLYTLAQQLRTQTSSEVATEVAEVRISDKELFHNPFAVLVGDRKLPRLTQAESDILKKWLEAGGTLFADTSGGTGPGEDFDASLRDELERMFPRNPLSRVAPEHVLYRSFYRLDYPAGRIIHRPYLEAVSLEGRLAVIHSQNDVVGAWCRDGAGQWEFDATPGGELQRDAALRLGVNLVEYALCQDYKDDQVHIDYLLRKRKWKIDVPRPTP
jgi:hypothetical protein